MGCCSSKQCTLTTADFAEVPFDVKPEISYHVLGLNDMEAAIRCMTRAFSGNANAESDDYVPTGQGAPGDPLQNWMIGAGDFDVALEDKIAHHEYLCKFGFHQAYHLKGILLGTKYNSTLASVAAVFPSDSPGRDLYSNPCAGIGILCCRMGGKMPPGSDAKKYGKLAGKRSNAVEVGMNELSKFMKPLKGRYWKIEILAVDPKFQGKGIAREAIKAIQWLADRENMPLYIECAGDRLAETYKKMGFCDDEHSYELKLDKDDPGPSLKLRGLLKNAKNSGASSDPRKVVPAETE
eukprot:gnl/MRDRNA2_/MRDRNA2_18313_c0_seq1.p1 gnl/MRDRNA2_/MRDRNA2_18313_c0~~gnl/MRDRNA2_/MRDRNA2_18313_c0_seq1.p1  ORF type:complete len:294 (+),score=45.23 gnl/MRDRNA2_/MRDRNA2_18313_c0_seq1:120-1001(+)